MTDPSVGSSGAAAAGITLPRLSTRRGPHGTVTTRLPRPSDVRVGRVNNDAW
jgi:hypothetical protein